MQILHCEYSEHGYDENEYEYEYASRRCSEVLEAKNAKTQAEIMSILRCVSIISDCSTDLWLMAYGFRQMQSAYGIWPDVRFLIA